MTITICDMWSRDTEAQQIMWAKYNKMMAKNEFPKPNFKGFMANSAQANLNVARIVYGFGDSSIRIVDEECTYLFH